MCACHAPNCVAAAPWGTLPGSANRGAWGWPSLVRSFSFLPPLPPRDEEWRRDFSFAAAFADARREPRGVIASAATAAGAPSSAAAASSPSSSFCFSRSSLSAFFSPKDDISYGEHSWPGSAVNLTNLVADRWVRSARCGCVLCFFSFFFFFFAAAPSADSDDDAARPSVPAAEERRSLRRSLRRVDWSWSGSSEEVRSTAEIEPRRIAFFFRMPTRARARSRQRRPSSTAS